MNAMMSSGIVRLEDIATLLQAALTTTNAEAQQQAMRQLFMMEQQVDDVL
jgi:hypothetical protein